jgi:hypothetical protein
MYNFEIVYLARIRHEELIAEAEKWAGRNYGFYPELTDQPVNRIVAALKALFIRQPARKSTSTFTPASGTRSLRAAAK